jgi:hypothetical protein
VSCFVVRVPPETGRRAALGAVVASRPGAPSALTLATSPRSVNTTLLQRPEGSLQLRDGAISTRRDAWRGQMATRLLDEVDEETP